MILVDAKLSNETKIKSLKKYHIISYGCQMNFADSEIVASILENIGYDYTDDIDCLLYTSPSPRD